jgi:hypothetical protein
MCPSQENIITIFSDRDYMRGMYEKLMFIRAMNTDAVQFESH